MSITDKRNGDIYDNFPVYCRLDLPGGPYGWLVVVGEKVLYFYTDYSNGPDTAYQDVTNLFEL